MRSIIASLLCLGLFGVAGCGSDSGSDRAITIDGEGSGGKKAPTLAPHGKQLTQAQIDKALLTVDDMPSGWAVSEQEEEEEEADEDEVIEPEKCAEVLDAFEASTDEEPAAEGDIDFSNGGPFGMQLTHTIESHEEPLAGDQLVKVADALEACPEFTFTDAEGTVTKVKASAMSFPNLGDETLALSFDMEVDEFEITMSVVTVAIGHNTVSVLGGGFTGVPGKQMETISRKAVDKLEKTV